MSAANDKIIEQAQERFERCVSWEADARVNFVSDMKFAVADSDNGYAWPQGIFQERSRNGRPCLTINKVRQHCLQIINDQRQHESQITVRPTQGDASFEAAQVFEGLIRHIENQSNAQAAYNNACYGQVLGGIGWWRVVTDWSSADSFDQEIFIRRVQDPLSVYLDPDTNEADGSDARFGFVFRDMPRSDFEAEYGKKLEEEVGHTAALSGDDTSWESKDHVRVAEYFTRTDVADKLYLLPDGQTIRRSQIDDPDLHKQVAEMATQSRDVASPEIHWYLLAGSKVIDDRPWPGKYIPLVRLIGEESVIDRRLDRIGHVRHLRDPARLINFWFSSAVESVALQPRAPFIADVSSIAGFENEWRQANIENYAYLPYKSKDENGQPLQKPERSPPPVMSEAYLRGMDMAKELMLEASGQYNENFGQQSNVISGVAIGQRERQGSNATFHYIDRLAQALRFTGRILVDLIPKVYDTARVVKILGVDGSQHSIQIDPNQQMAHQQVQDPDADDYNPQAISAIFNPAVGEYQVEADVGPAYATKRQETFNAISQIIQTNQSVAPLISDLLFLSADFPLADVIAERLKRMIPPQALGQGPTPEVQRLQQQLAAQHQIMANMGQELEQAKDKLASTEQRVEIDMYNAETGRLKAVGGIDAAALRPVVRELVSQILGQPVNPIIEAHAMEEAAMHASLPQPPQPDQTQSPNPGQ